MAKSKNAASPLLTNWTYCNLALNHRHWTLPEASSIMMTSSNGSIFRDTGPMWGNPPVTGGFPSLTRIFDVLFDMRRNKLLSKQLRRRWIDTSSRSLWRHDNDCLLFFRSVAGSGPGLRYTNRLHQCGGVQTGLGRSRCKGEATSHRRHQNETNLSMRHVWSTR